MEAGRAEPEWARLEGRAELLETARLRFEALGQQLSAFSWRERLGRSPQLVAEVAWLLPQVDPLLEVLERRARAEAWPATDALLQLLVQVKGARARLQGRLQRRLGQEDVSLRVLLSQLERVLAEGEAPPEAGEEAWELAHRLLPANLEALRQAMGAAGVLQLLGQRPALGSGPFPYTPQEAEELLQARAVAGRTLARLWARLARLEASGRVDHVLRQRARHPLLQWPRSGPEMLVHTAFWQDFVEERLGVLVAERVRPLQPRPGELPALLRFLAGGAVGPLQVEGGEARGALLTLAWGLWAREAGRAVAPEALLRWAQQAEPLAHEEDGARLVQLLRAALTARGQAVRPEAGLVQQVAAVLATGVSLEAPRPASLQRHVPSPPGRGPG